MLRIFDPLGRLVGEDGNIPERILRPQTSEPYGLGGQVERNREVLQAVLSGLLDYQLFDVCARLGYSAQYMTNDQILKELP